MSAIPCGFEIDCRNLDGGSGFAAGGLSSPNGFSDFNGLDFPVSNYSSEAPEQVPHDVIMTWPDLWNKMGCLALCVSTVSENAANLCAMAQQAQCNPTNDPGGDGGTGGGGGGGGTKPLVFFSQSQSCSFTCSNGSTFTYTVPAGVFSAATLAVANANAHDFACKQAANACKLPSPGIPPTIPSGNGFTIDPIAPGCLGVPYSKIIPTTPPNKVVLWQILIGALPPGLTFNDKTGLVSGTPTVAGTFNIVIRGFNVDGNHSQRPYTFCIINVAPGTFFGDVGVPFTQAFTGAECATDQLWQIFRGFLPTGLKLDSTTGVISGTPTVDGTFLFSVSVTGDGFSCTKACMFTVNPCNNITTASPLTPADESTPYSEQLNSTGITHPVWSIMSGALPGGLSLSASGLISGTPTESGTFNFRVMVTGDNSAICSKAFTLTVGAPCPSVIDQIGPGLTSNSGAIGSTNPIYGRVLVADDGPPATIYFIDTSTNTIINSVALDTTGTVVFANDKFYVIANADQTTFRVYDGDGVLVTTIPIGSIIYDFIYSPEQDRIYLRYFDSVHTHIVSVNPNTDAVDSDVDIGPSNASGDLMYSPNRLFVSKLDPDDNPEIFHEFSLPALTPGGTLNFNPGGHLALGWGFSAITGKLYVGASNNVTFNPEIRVINPATLVVEQLLTVSGYVVLVNDTDGVLISCDIDGNTTIIKLADNSTVCSFSVPLEINQMQSVNGVAFDVGTHNYYFTASVANLCSVYH